jgi:hypothetical protein
MFRAGSSKRFDESGPPVVRQSTLRRALVAPPAVGREAR